MGSRAINMPHPNGDPTLEEKLALFTKKRDQYRKEEAGIKERREKREALKQKEAEEAKDRKARQKERRNEKKSSKEWKDGKGWSL
ncbi:hypothetical protein CLAFUW4_10551 [Fulvia fulva]|uniref:Uncharacterized protein n=1 Tax=Passalora fulva TaxID=5499 RepID=A0A9Q8LEN2_PASFU|nr:uncharacterized protein CLAFUR5_05165 [Fulvia fulva]KAK4615800.1 hypothetical protein CLAFUR4_10556 [Fulvia fulva]KAK4616447.1 hypothetical protein CLAFUR0_10688 [Fulvia fulva]UJO16085.1 hypothetical protein CLAFUR5_05165 [Fulvia fulva]WPV18792.1 hypothetical protein CLAFUW4_10551 [Fulvia fulva]WPV34558.1 hypothetical protein CLAFUW7_10553 [Fulvia fulva]